MPIPALPALPAEHPMAIAAFAVAVDRRNCSPQDPDRTTTEAAVEAIAGHLHENLTAHASDLELALEGLDAVGSGYEEDEADAMAERIRARQALVEHALSALWLLTTNEYSPAAANRALERVRAVPRSL